MKPPPPILPAVGWTTASANAVATAASTAVPPSLIASAPMRDAVAFCDATMPFWARTGTELAPVPIERRVAATTRSARVLVMTADYTAVVNGTPSSVGRRLPQRPQRPQKRPEGWEQGRRQRTTGPGQVTQRGTEVQRLPASVRRPAQRATKRERAVKTQASTSQS